MHDSVPNFPLGVLDCICQLTGDFYELKVTESLQLVNNNQGTYL